jgi:hypothetical protein
VGSVDLGLVEVITSPSPLGERYLSGEELRTIGHRMTPG